MPDTTEDLSQYDFTSEPQVESAEAAAPPKPPHDPVTGQFISPSAEPAPAKPAHSPRLARMASDFGMSEDEINDHTPEQLESVVHQLQKQLINDAASRRQRRPEAPAPVDADPDLPFDPEAMSIAPEIANFFKGIVKTNADLQKKLKSLEERDVQRESQAQASRLDKAFQKHADYFGSQTFDEFDDPLNLHFLRRKSAIEIMKADQGQRTIEGKVAFAKKVLMGDVAPPPKTEQVVNPELEQRKRDFAEGALAAPTHRAPAPERPGAQAAKREFLTQARAAGLPVNGSVGSDDFQP